MAYSMGQPQYSFGPGATVKGAELGGSGLQGSPESYFKIVRCILNGGELGGARLLKKETVDSMFVSHLSKDPEIKKVQVQVSYSRLLPIHRADPASTGHH